MAGCSSHYMSVYWRMKLARKVFGSILQILCSWNPRLSEKTKSIKIPFERCWFPSFPQVISWTPCLATQESIHHCNLRSLYEKNAKSSRQCQRNDSAISGFKSDAYTATHLRGHLGSLHSQPKQCTIIREMFQNYCTFAFVWSPKKCVI